MKKFLIGFVLGVAFPLVAIYAFFILGGMPVATEGKSLPLERFFVHSALRAAIKDDVDKKPPLMVDEAGLLSGAKVYLNQCAGCHGLPDSKAPLFSKTMFPRAPQLFTEQENVIDDPVGETYWKIKNGIRLTGMPAFKTILSEVEIWQVSTLLSEEDKLPSKIKEALK